MTETPRWTLPLLLAGQAQKEISHNEALEAIDRVLHLAVLTRTLNRPPSNARTGDTVIIGAAPVGDWRDCANMIASSNGTSWILTTPRSGCLAWICDEAVLAVFHGERWRPLATLGPTA